MKRRLILKIMTALPFGGFVAKFITTAVKPIASVVKPLETSVPVSKLDKVPILSDKELDGVFIVLRKESYSNNIKIAVNRKLLEAWRKRILMSQF